MPNKPSNRSAATFRFAHPFFTTTPAHERALVPGVGRRLTDAIKDRLKPVPRPRGTARMSLADIIGSPGVAEIQAEGALRFHAVGDTGRKPDSPQEFVANAMARDYDAAQPGRSPAFLFHLGDVIYGPGKEQAYRREFYEPYKGYPGKIVAIPGNHDGETFPGTDPKHLRAFKSNFCAPAAVVPPAAGTIFRQTMTQPGVYWLLETPFVDIIGLYSNIAENPGYLSGAIPGRHQTDWLVRALRRVRAARPAQSRKALVVATHHPPFSSGGHSGSSEMLQDFDDACRQVGILPDLFLSGHAHSYQRYTRTQPDAGEPWEIPYVVAGTGGVGAQSVPDAAGQQTGDHVYVRSFKGYGFLLLTARLGALDVEFLAVDQADCTSVDRVHVDLATHRLS